MSDLKNAKAKMHLLFLVEFALARINLDELGRGGGTMTREDFDTHKAWVKEAKREAGGILINSGLDPKNIRLFWRQARQEIRARLGNGK